MKLVILLGEQSTPRRCQTSVWWFFIFSRTWCKCLQGFAGANWQYQVCLYHSYLLAQIHTAQSKVSRNAISDSEVSTAHQPDRIPMDAQTAILSNAVCTGSCSSSYTLQSPAKPCRPPNSHPHPYQKRRTLGVRVHRGCQCAFGYYFFKQ